MSNIRFRIAKPSDYKQIADCHWHVRDRYTTGIFLSLGKGFLKAYYKIILDDPNEVVVCAETEDRRIVGFNSASLDFAAQIQNLKKHKIRLALAAIGAIIRRPSLLKQMRVRYKSLSSNYDAPKFMNMNGARGEYWCWLKSAGDISQSVELNIAAKHILYDLGVRVLYSEVDKGNKRVYNYFTKYYKAAKIEIIEEIALPDGRERVLLKETMEFDNK